MSISTSLSRLVEYQRRHGFRATLGRAGIAAKRATFEGGMVVFYCDLYANKFRSIKIPAGFSIERIESSSAFSNTDFEQVTAFWNPKLASANVRERFARGAVLWLVKSGKSVAGYGWSLKGSTIKPYYFPLGDGDVHLFDFHVFAEFRGRGINPYLIASILNVLVATCDGRAFIEAAKWNTNQLLSLRKTPFRRLGLVSAFRVFGRLLTHWKTNDPIREACPTIAQATQITGALRSNE